MPAIARANRVLALDLPGFGGSAKPVAASYDFAFFEDAIDGFLDSLGIGDVAIAGHDLGGPVTAHWALGRADRVTGLALLNTLVYPEFSDAVAAFIHAGEHARHSRAARRARPGSRPRCGSASRTRRR